MGIERFTALQHLLGVDGIQDRVIRVESQRVVAGVVVAQIAQGHEIGIGGRGGVGQLCFAAIKRGVAVDLTTGRVEHVEVKIKFSARGRGCEAVGQTGGQIR